MDINAMINLAQAVGIWVIALLLAYGMGLFGDRFED